ncbi:MAG: replication initiator protein A [Lachnospiraceae bacterium]|nr:replication initiator protein A [Lachnospiraceae bacterium]
MITDADFYHGSDIIKSEFYQFQAVLLDSDDYSNLSNDARVLYAVMQKRLHLSMDNGWLDQNGRTFFYYSREELAEKIKVSLPTCRKAVKQLIDSELLYEVRQGLGKANRLYLLKPKVFQIEEIAPDQFNKGNYSDDSSQPLDSGGSQSEESFHSRQKKSFSQERKNFSPKQIYNNHTENSYISPSTVSPKAYSSEMTDRVKKQIEYDSLCDTHNVKMLDAIVDVIVSVMGFSKDTYRIGNYYHDASRVKEVFSQVDKEAVEHTIDAIRNSTEKIFNYRNYIISVLFNHATNPAAGWKQKPKNSFHDFEQRTYDDDLYKQIMEAQGL